MIWTVNKLAIWSPSAGLKIRSWWFWMLVFGTPGPTSFSKWIKILFSGCSIGGPYGKEIVVFFGSSPMWQAGCKFSFRPSEVLYQTFGQIWTFCSSINKSEFLRIYHTKVQVFHSSSWNTDIYFAWRIHLVTVLRKFNLMFENSFRRRNALRSKFGLMSPESMRGFI